MYKSILHGLIIFVIASCNPDANRTSLCFNGIKDGNETRIDCGGPDCDPCKISCQDQMLNGDEEGVDCGGAFCIDCNPIVTEFTATINTTPFTNSVNSADLVNKVFNISGLVDDVSITIMIPANVDPGFYEIPESTLSGFVNDGSVDPPLFYVSISGDFTIAAHDRLNKKITGTFEFGGSASGGETLVVTNGSFQITY
jgi:hypothetical protein